MDFISGEILCIDKPLRWTSFDVVNKVRWSLCRHLGVKKLKVGHAGTLDPLATGLMLVCTGKATKRIDELQAQTKEYVATVQLGATTPSFDLEQPVDACFSTEHITRETVEQMLQQFVGHIQQVPPTFSAVKVDGKRAYSIARTARDVVIQPKDIVISELELLDYNPTPENSIQTALLPREGMRRKAFLTANIDNVTRAYGPSFDIRVVCSKGTYIRALARDMGIALASGAHLTALRRTRVGDYSVEQAITMDDFMHNLQS